MIVLKFLGPAAIDFAEPLELEASSLADIAQRLAQDERAQKWLKISAVAINGTISSDHTAALKDGDEVSILPPVCGG